MLHFITLVNLLLNCLNHIFDLIMSGVQSHHSHALLISQIFQLQN